MTDGVAHEASATEQASARDELRFTNFPRSPSGVCVLVGLGHRGTECAAWAGSARIACVKCECEVRAAALIVLQRSVVEARLAVGIDVIAAGAQKERQGSFVTLERQRVAATGPQDDRRMGAEVEAQQAGPLRPVGDGEALAGAEQFGAG